MYPEVLSEARDWARAGVKLPASKLRQATSSHPAQSSRQSARESFSGGEIIEGKRNRSQKKSYVVETSDDDEEEEEDDDEDAEGEDDDMMDEDDDDDAEGEIVVDDTMDIDAEGDEDDKGEEDAEGEDDDMDMSVIPPPAPVIKVSKPSAKKGGASKSRAAAKSAASKGAASHVKESDDEELSELESDADEIQDTVKVGGGDDEDAEGEDEEIEGAEPIEEDDLGSDDDEGEAPDLTKMTKRQRARFEENGDAALMKLSDEVQAKKHFTAEELSMRRAEMARRRRNLSEKRNEEVKMETINKLLKKQAPKTNRKGQAGMELTPDAEGQKPSPIFVRWVSNKDGPRVAVPDEMLVGPAGRVFVNN
ncbi:putative papa-1-like conserved region family protein [Rosellinia necatrix]|uniref:Putative papa-1-like conserved region family protein n=1 Tax=Rosellinia necatrix TaxID=77044 RepID=A0A1W2TP36_ROSNE|nr:putative papa-1-like conserved region family protein [Rosellinia necatrix]